MPKQAVDAPLPQPWRFSAFSRYTEPPPAARGKWQQTCRLQLPPASLTLPPSPSAPSLPCLSPPPATYARTREGGRGVRIFASKAYLWRGDASGRFQLPKGSGARAALRGSTTSNDLTRSAVLSEESFCPRFDLQEITRLWLLQCLTAEWTE